MRDATAISNFAHYCKNPAVISEAIKGFSQLEKRYPSKKDDPGAKKLATYKMELEQLYNVVIKEKTTGAPSSTGTIPKDKNKQRFNWLTGKREKSKELSLIHI